MENYNEALEHIKTLERFGSVPGLNNIRNIMHAFGNMQDYLKFIHVAGTNGKGSTSQFIATGLIEAGYRVGVFSSPSIKDYRERIKINNEMISQDDFARMVNAIKDSKLPCTEFELSTAVAILYFFEKKCDYVVLEVGMGGILDSTNIIRTAELAVLTPISLDHTDVLGNTLSKIAWQKCGIIKPKSKVVSAIQAPKVNHIIKKQAEKKSAQLTFAKTPSIISTSLEGTQFSYNENTYNIKLLGTHQASNAAVAIEALNALGISHPNLQNAFLPCRFQKITDNLFYDAAHNPAGAIALANCIDTYFSGIPLTIIMGMLADKDYKSTVKILASKASKFIAITPNSPRALPADELAKIACKFCENVKVGFSIKDANPSQLTICCGSFSIFS